MILYFCPNVPFASSGVRLLYRHVEILNRHGYSAAILFNEDDQRPAGMPSVPVRYIYSPDTFTENDYVVIPEGLPNFMQLFKGYPLNLIAIALNWQYIYMSLDRVCPDFLDWRSFGIQQAMVNCSFIGDMIDWAMKIPCHAIVMGIDPRLYTHEPEKKVPQISYIPRKANRCDELKRLLHSRNPAFTENIAWRGMEGLPEEDYAREVRQSRVFLNLSVAEGFPFSLVEAMRAGTVVAGYNSVGGQRDLIAEGEKQNCILAENLDYVTLAQRLEPLLLDVLRGDLSRWGRVIANGIELSNHYTREEEERTTLLAWKNILAKPPAVIPSA
jgi:glycosyltransferase involved in cell wall biosynthesis